MTTSAPESTIVGSEIITVGDEILRGDVVNGNAAFMGQQLAALGLPPQQSVIIADRIDDIVTAIQAACARSEIVLMSGGLGPTPDDLTREAVAKAFGLSLQEDADLLAHVQRLFRSRGMEMPETSRNQAMFPVGATPIPNPHGTAFGIHVERDGCHVFALPGVPIEMRQMVSEYVVPAIRNAFPTAVLVTKTLRLGGIGESHLLERLGDQSAVPGDVSMAFLPHHGLLDIRLTSHSRDYHEAEAQLARVENLVREQVGEHIYATGSVRLAEAIGNILLNRGQRLATAESCTGGLIADMLTDTPGSSRWFDRGWVAYSNEAKVRDLGVPAETIGNHGAVSEPVARLMADGARQRAGAQWAVASTGIAGPDGGSSEKPVGTVWIAVSSELQTSARLLQLGGLRETIKLRTAHIVLFTLFRRLMTES